MGRTLTKGASRREWARVLGLARVSRWHVVLICHLARARAKVRCGVIRSRRARLSSFPNGVRRGLLRCVYVVNVLLRHLEDSARVRRCVECVRANSHLGRSDVRLSSQGVISCHSTMFFSTAAYRVHPRYVSERNRVQVVHVRCFRNGDRAFRLLFQ